MTRVQLDAKLELLLDTVRRDLEKECARLFSCGGIDPEIFGDTCELPKILLKAALLNEASHMGMTEAMNKAAKNLGHF
jgi:hypothetical protein